MSSIGEIATFRNSIQTDTVDEYTSASGVTVDGVLLKDAEVTASGTNGVITNVIKAQAASGVKFQENGGTEVGSYTDGGAWTLGPATGSITHSIKSGSSTVVRLDTGLFTGAETSALAFGANGQERFWVGYDLANALLDFKYDGTSTTFSGASSIGKVTAAGAWTLGPAAGGVTHIINGSASLSGSLVLQRTALTASATGTATITVTGSYHTITGASGAASTVTTINGGVTGSHLVLRATSDTVDITLATGGNLALAGGASFTLDSYLDTISFIYDATLSKWLELYRSSNS